MAGNAIEVIGLSKVYKIDHELQRASSFRDAITAALVSPFRRLVGKAPTGTTREDFWALRDVSFEVPRGQVLGIIGSNGAGKSTLLKILSRIVEPSAGRAIMRGRVASLLEVGTGFHPELTGRENIFLNGSILGMRRREIEARFDEIVDFSGIERFLDTPVKRYSSGMYVRLAFGVAAHLEPEILIVDEVLAVGDAAFQKKCLGKMQDVARNSNRTVLFVSHNMPAVKSLCSKAVLLAGGRLVAEGDVDSVVSKYIDSTGGTKRFMQLDRPVGADLWMESVSLLCAGSASAPIKMGDELSMQIAFRSSEPITRPKFGWVLSDGAGTRLLGANNRYNESPPTPSPVDAGMITCHLGMVPLMPGRYQFSLYLGDESRDTHVLLDKIGFEVEPHDIWGFAKLPPVGAQALWWPSRFEITS